jgi:hypothetical protein
VTAADLYYGSVRGLGSSISSKLVSVTIVGMKHYADAFDKIIEISKRDRPDQCLFLVPDINNKFDKNAVMLHNGVSKLGHVVLAEAIEIRKILADQVLKFGQDVVLVVSIPPMTENFRWSSSLSVRVVGVVYERFARKYAATIN